MKQNSVLLVDDENAILKTLSFNLKNQGYSVDTAPSGKEAIRKFKQTLPDLVITDLKMEGIGGIEVLQTIKKYETDTMVMILTGNGSLETAIDALRMGAYDYLQKPFNRDELSLKVQKCLEKQSLERRYKKMTEDLIFAVKELNREVEKRKEAEKHLSLYRDQLETLVTHRTQELLEAKDAAEKASLVKSEFISHMSHEIRTPLNAVLGFAQLLNIDSVSFTSNQKQNLGQIINSGNHLLQLINEVLKLSSIESGTTEVTLEPVNVPWMIHNLISMLKPVAEKAQVLVKDEVAFTTMDLYVLADKLHIKQVLLNLITNAIKYNRPKGTIRIRSKVSKEGILRIDVIDTGIGIPEEKQNLLFKPFERLHCEEASTEGTGIGLSISKKLIELMNGTIGYEKNPTGEGSCFYIEMQRADKAQLGN